MRDVGTSKASQKKTWLTSFQSAKATRERIARFKRRLLLPHEHPRVLNTIFKSSLERERVG
jgi:hypothetical protein